MLSGIDTDGHPGHPTAADTILASLYILRLLDNDPVADHLCKYLSALNNNLSSLLKTPFFYEVHFRMTLIHVQSRSDQATIIVRITR